MRITFYLLSILIVLCFAPGAYADQNQHSDGDALAGLKSSKTVFDINVSDVNKLDLYLGVIGKTRLDLLRQGVEPEIIIAFRGASVRLVNSETWSFSEEDQQVLNKVAAYLKELSSQGVKLEACSIATDLYKVDNATILPEIKVVGNTFVSLTGYQSKGYALIPIN